MLAQHGSSYLQSKHLGGGSRDLPTSASPKVAFVLQKAEDTSFL